MKLQGLKEIFVRSLAWLDAEINIILNNDVIVIHII